MVKTAAEHLARLPYQLAERHRAGVPSARCRATRFGMSILKICGVFPGEQPPCALGNILASSNSIFAAIQIEMKGTTM
ncbi:MAG TPA: hypothetical protein VJ045_13080, partial [Hyphomicrobiaceae bacterium]|nr:hypothetical protein [Hyphomicrobiaceae bacterium]